MESHNDIVLCTHKVKCYKEDNTPTEAIIPHNHVGIRSGEIAQDEFADMLIGRGLYPFHTSSFFMRKTVYDSEIFKNLLGKMNGDQVCLYSCLALGKIYYLEDAMSVRRMLTIGNG